MTDKRFVSPRNFSKTHGFPLHKLRELIARGEVPGFFSGSYFHIDQPAFLERLAVAAQNNERF